MLLHLSATFPEVCSVRAAAATDQLLQISWSDPADMHLNTVVFFSAAFSHGREFQASYMSPHRVIEVTKGAACQATWFPVLLSESPDSQQPTWDF